MQISINILRAVSHDALEFRDAIVLSNFPLNMTDPTQGVSIQIKHDFLYLRSIFKKIWVPCMC